MNLKPNPLPFPWREAIGFGLGVLRLSPEQFWRMTPRELAYAIEAVTGRGGAPLSRAAVIGDVVRHRETSSSDR